MCHSLGAYVHRKTLQPALQVLQVVPGVWQRSCPCTTDQPACSSHFTSSRIILKSETTVSGSQAPQASHQSSSSTCAWFSLLSCPAHRSHQRQWIALWPLPPLPSEIRAVPTQVPNTQPGAPSPLRLPRPQIRPMRRWPPLVPVMEKAAAGLCAQAARPPLTQPLSTLRHHVRHRSARGDGLYRLWVGVRDAHAPRLLDHVSGADLNQDRLRHLRLVVLARPGVRV
jgi:hypothetical protein